MKLFLIALAISLVVTSIGFKKYVWFISIGYGFSISAIGIMLLFMGGNIPLSLLLIVYGFRLGGYLTFREIKTTYNSRMVGEVKQNKDMPMAGRIGLWLTSGLLYPLMCSSAIFRAANGTEDDTLMYVGLGISAFGIIFETIADFQKQKAKKKNADRFVDTGLYKIVRCPNYLGELIMWTGCVIGGIHAYNSILQWVMAILGYMSITYTMFSGARRLETRQNKRYGSDAEYKKYHDSTPIMIPLIPLYSVENQKWLVG